MGKEGGHVLWEISVEILMVGEATSNYLILRTVETYLNNCSPISTAKVLKLFFFFEPEISLFTRMIIFPHRKGCEQTQWETSSEDPGSGLKWTTWTQYVLFSLVSELINVLRETAAKESKYIVFTGEWAKKTWRAQTGLPSKTGLYSQLLPSLL